MSAVPVDFPDWKVVLVTSDITERKQAEERFRLAIEAAPAAVIMVDQHGQIILVNSQAEKYFGYDRVELMTKSIDNLVPGVFLVTTQAIAPYSSHSRKPSHGSGT